MLEKQQKYKQLIEKVNKINQFQQNFIQCMSTIKISLSQLIHDFFKSDQSSVFQKIQRALLSQFDTIKEVCLNLFRKVQAKLSNYQNEIANLNKNYKQQLQQMIHYQRKVETIKKASLETKDDKEKLQRNVDKKRFFQKGSAKTEKLLIQNYQNFQIESEKLLLQCPREILIHFIKGNFLAHQKLSQILHNEIPFNPNRLRKNSVISAGISDISDLDCSDHLSEPQEGDQIKQDEIQMIIDPESAESMKNGSQIIELNDHQDISDVQHFQFTSPSKFKESSAKKIKRSTFKKTSIENNIKNQENWLQELKKMIELQIQSPHLKYKSHISLDKAFEQVHSPLTRQNRKEKIFASFKNKYSENGKKVSPKKLKNLQKIERKAKDHFEEKCFVLSKQEFQNTHSPKSRNNLKIKGPQRYLKNEQTLNDNHENENSSESTQKNQEGSCASLSSRIQKRNVVLKMEEQNSKKIEQNTKHLKTEPPQLIKKQYSFNQQHKINKEKRSNQKNHQLVHSIQTVTNNNIQTALSLDVGLQNFQNLEEKRQPSKLGQQEKNKMVEQLFSITALKNKKNQAANLNKKQVYLNTERSKESDPQNWFSTTFLNSKSSNSPQQIKRNQNIFGTINMENFDCSRTKSTNQPLNDSKIDFSIFSKIV